MTACTIKIRMNVAVPGYGQSGSYWPLFAILVFMMAAVLLTEDFIGFELSSNKRCIFFIEITIFFMAKQVERVTVIGEYFNN